MNDPLRRWYATAYFGPDYFLIHPEPPEEQNRREVDQMLGLLDLQPPAKVLDFGCGWGRHSMELARRGFDVTGQDLSRTFLSMARERAAKEGLGITWVHADMREVPYREAFDAAVCINSVLGVLEGDEQDARAVGAVAGALKAGGRLLVDQVNRECIMGRYQATDFWERESGHLVLVERRLNLRESVGHVTMTLICPDGVRKTYQHAYRFYTLTELARMLEGAGLQVEDVWGGLDGSTYGLDSRRMVILARKA